MPNSMFCFFNKLQHWRLLKTCDFFTACVQISLESNQAFHKWEFRKFCGISATRQLFDVRKC
jgi:hypothetical protein